MAGADSLVVRGSLKWASMIQLVLPRWRIHLLTYLRLGLKICEKQDIPRLSRLVCGERNPYTRLRIPHDDSRHGIWLELRDCRHELTGRAILRIFNPICL